MSKASASNIRETGEHCLLNNVFAFVCSFKVLKNFCYLFNTGEDLQSGDGVYTAVILRECQGGNGRHSGRVIITGNEETTVVNYFSSSQASIIGISFSLRILIPQYFRFDFRISFKLKLQCILIVTV